MIDSPNPVLSALGSALAPFAVLIIFVSVSSAAIAGDVDFYSLEQSDRAKYCKTITDQVITTQAGQKEFKEIFGSFYSGGSDMVTYESSMNDLISEHSDRYQESPEAAASGIWGRLKCNELYVQFLKDS